MPNYNEATVSYWQLHHSLILYFSQYLVVYVKNITVKIRVSVSTREFSQRQWRRLVLV